MGPFEVRSVGRSALSLGSANANQRGFFDTELNVLLDEPDAARSFRHRLWAHDLGVPENAVAAAYLVGVHIPVGRHRPEELRFAATPAKMAGEGGGPARSAYGQGQEDARTFQMFGGRFDRIRLLSAALRVFIHVLHRRIPPPIHRQVFVEPEVKAEEAGDMSAAHTAPGPTRNRDCSNMGYWPWGLSDSECQVACPVARKLKAIDVIDVLSDLFILRGVPGHIRSDNGPEFIAKAVQEWISAVGPRPPTSLQAARGRTAMSRASMHPR